MLPTTSTLLLILTTLVMIGSAHAQTSGPSSLRSSLTNQFERDRIDTLYSDRPSMVIGWNFGAAMRGTNEDLRTNTYHCDFPFRWDPTSTTRPQFSLATIPDRTRLILAPTAEVLDKRSSPADASVMGTLDLRTMQARPSDMPSVVLQPLPANDKVTVILDRPGTADLAVVDLAGRTLIRATTDHSGVAEIDVSALTPAAYTIRATVEGHVLHAPFMIMRP